VIDIDNFKAVNDTHGHSAGDQVLARVADALKHGTRPTDLVARLGGDEFVALLADFDADAASQRAAELVDRVAAEPWDLLATDLHVSVSIGVAVWTLDGAPHEDSERVVRRADSALYAAKALGGDRVEVAQQTEEALSG
jgi:diguanylate cyclase (GGDEF)-like protein